MSNIQGSDPFDIVKDEIWSHRRDFSVDEVDEITLLSVEEARKLPQDVLKASNWWWLRSPGDNQCGAASVNFGGDVSEFGLSVGSGGSAVRPAFRINNLKLPFGEKVTVNNVSCTAIDKGLVLADKCICNRRFDKYSNNWETSELKRFIESDEFKNYILKGSYIK